MGRARRRAAALGIGLALLAGADQLALRTVLADGELRGLRIAPYPSARFFSGQDQALADLRAKLARAEPTWLPFDPELGWAPRPDTDFGSYAYDARGARIGNPPEARPAGPATLRVAAYGCSFTHGDEVDGPDTWAAALERIADVRVENFGVGGYGLDQALLRMRRTLDPAAADEVWFGLLPGASLRVTTCYRPLVSPWSNALAFKPRFEVVGEDGLRLVPDPAASVEDVVRLMERPELFLERMRAVDPWVARRPAAFAPLGASPWHRSALGRLFLTWSVRSAPDPSAALADPGSRAYRTLRAILLAARREVEAAGLGFRVLVLPGPYDLRDAAGRAEPPWRAFAEELAARGVVCLDLAPDLGGPPEELFVSRDGHYSAAGNRQVARAIAERFGLATRP